MSYRLTTDLDDEALVIARGGMYPETIDTDVSENRLKRFFVREDQFYRVLPEPRESIMFAEHNLLCDAPFSRLDLVTCRNVLIYLDLPTQSRILEMFHFGLRKGGVLMLGTAETVASEIDLFEPVSREHRLYRRNGMRPRPPRQQPMNIPARGPRGLSTSPALHTTLPANNAARLAQRILLEQHAPAAVLINQKFEGLYFSGPVDRFLKDRR